MTDTTAPTYNFTDAEIPASKAGATKLPNPFDGVFPRDDKAVSLTVKGAGDSAEVKRLVSQARKAARTVERTARVEVTTEGGKGKEQTTLLVWTRPLIVRARDNAPAGPEAEASASNPNTATA